MALTWNQVEGGEQIRDKIIAFANPRFHKIEKHVPVTGQVKFKLSFIPTDEVIKMDINGLTYYENVHFSVNRDEDPPSLTWIYTKGRGGFNIENEDLIYIEYWSYYRA